MAQERGPGQRGRLMRYWDERIETWRQGGLSQSQYCRQHHLKYHRFIYWKKRLSKSGPSAVTFVPVGIDPVKGIDCCSGRARLGVVIGGRYKIEIEHGFDARLLGQVITALERLP